MNFGPIASQSDVGAMIEWCICLFPIIVLIAYAIHTCRDSWARAYSGQRCTRRAAAPQPLVLFKKLRADALVPRYMTAHAAGLDLSAALDAPVEILPGQRVAIDTGLTVKLPEGYEGQIRPRSGLAREHGVTLINTPGTIDADYTGPLVVLLINHGDRVMCVETGQRIAQLVVAPVVQAILCEVDVLPATVRGAGGFGSTGKS